MAIPFFNAGPEPPSDRKPPAPLFLSLSGGHAGSRNPMAYDERYHLD